MTDDAAVAGLARVALAHEIARVNLGLEPTPQRVVRTLRALHRLARLAQSDANAWAALISRLWPSHATALLRNNRSAAARRIGLWVNVQGTSADWMCTFLTTHGLAYDAPSVPVPLQLHLLFGHNPNRSLASVERLVAAQTTRPHIFALDRILCLTQNVENADALSQLADLATRGVAVPTFPHLDLDVTPRTAASLVRSFERLFTTDRSCRRVVDSRTSNVASVKLVGRESVAQDRALAMLASATGESASVEEATVYLHDVGDDDAPYTRWLAYSLVSRESRHAIRHLRVESGTSSAVAVDGMIDVLSANDPVAGLYPDCAESALEYSHARLAVSAFTLYDPTLETSGDDAPTELTEHPYSGLRIVSRSRAWWGVVLPMWGRAWVRVEDATVTWTDEITEPPRHWIPTITVWMVTTDEMTKALSWLVYVGAGAANVSLSGSVGRHTGLGCGPRRVPSCGVALGDQRSRRLAHGTDRRVFRGRWRLQHLSLKNVSAAEGFVGLLRVLEDDGYAVTQTLESLVIIARRPGTPQASLIGAALRLLRASRRLHTFELCLKHAPATSGVDYATAQAAFEALGGRPRRAHVREKLALLSVASHSSTSGGALQRLDSRIVGDILRLTGFCPNRSVRLVLTR